MVVGQSTGGGPSSASQEGGAGGRGLGGQCNKSLWSNGGGLSRAALGGLRSFHDAYVHAIPLPYLKSSLVCTSARGGIREGDCTATGRSPVKPQPIFLLLMTLKRLES